MTDPQEPRPRRSSEAELGAMARAADRAGYINMDEARTLLALAMRDPAYDEMEHMVTLHLSLDVFVKTFELVERYGPMNEESGHRLIFTRAEPPASINDYFELRVLGPEA